jgi:uncharacterized repeat protein (TIGR03803 family)
VQLILFEESMMKNTAQLRNWISMMRVTAASAALALAVVLVPAVITSQSAQAQTFAEVYSFNMTDGAGAEAGLVQGTDGNLYGTTYTGGAAGSGTVFKITPGGTLTRLYSFCSQSDCTDGAGPYAAVIQATDGNFYGTTVNGGAYAYGTVFKITPSGMLTTLYSFCTQSDCADGEEPYGGLIQATDGNLYGTTYFGGAYSHGTVFKITLTGTLTTLHSFCAQTGCTDGGYTQAGLVQGSDGNFYGTTITGGTEGPEDGTVFKITPSGTVTTLYSFCSTGGVCEPQPYAALIQASDGNFYGTATGGPYAYGSVSKIAPGGTLTTLYIFTGGADGSQPYAGLVQGTDGNLYGTTYFGGASSDGTVFEVATSGALTSLYSFCSQSDCTDGEAPYAGLVQDTNGNFYGTTQSGGAKGYGTIFSLSAGLGLFVKTLPTSSLLGPAVNILGTNLTGATSVSFNGTAAEFNVVSASLITTTVPAGATSGFVTVITPSGTLTSNLPFEITLASTLTSVTSSLNPSTFGQPVTFTATVSSSSGTPLGTVTFMNGSGTLGARKVTDGVASFTTTTLGVGAKSITAVYGGSTSFGGSTSSVLSQVVNQAATTFTLTSSQNPSSLGQAVTFTATVAPEFSGTATSEVLFKEGSATLGTVALTDGVATFTTASLTSGKHEIAARYSGSKNFSTSSGALTQTVN